MSKPVGYVPMFVHNHTWSCTSEESAKRLLNQTLWELEIQLMRKQLLEQLHGMGYLTLTDRLLEDINEKEVAKTK